MRMPEPVTLFGRHVRLEPMHADHEPGLQDAAADGELWRLRVTSVPEPEQTAIYIANALMGQQDGIMLPFVVRLNSTGKLIGSTRYHDILPDVDRLEIGYTWYARSMQRTAVNTESKLLLMTHAFEALGCAVVGLRTDNFNFASQRAIERLGARKDGVIRHSARRRDGTVRDTVMYSIVAGEWPEVKAQLQWQLERPRC
ncbi:MAG: GNAT family N-acetyltransferase [Burkholderiales bacterium]|jgi:RimJ/RimL family protein N-acetyltransferase|nr:GNAT family N-acetyltransferase [Burkholderiales bacterium]MCA3224721.1 GNAT family N-acetyltransferase [Burkholderiales bacterium]MCE2644838.1 GNAT family N-acetyltransferase [Burkholderiaceae bacterium]